MSKNSENYYDVLGISNNATAKEIREVYISLCKDLHPDKLPSESGSHLKKLAEERLKLINEAYQILKDDSLRSEYDQTCTAEVGSNARESVDNIEDLLSPSVLSEGFEILQQEEQIIWSKHMQDIDDIEHQYHDYLSTVKGHKPRNLYPDTALLKLNRYLRIIYCGVPVAYLFSSFICGIFLQVFIFLGFKQQNIMIPIVISCGLLFVLSLCSYIFSEGSLDDNDLEYIYYDKLPAYWITFRGIGSYYRYNKLKSPIYEKTFVKLIRGIVKQLNKDILSLQESRKVKINKFKSINPYQLTPKYISLLSLSERFLLVKALEQKAKDEKGEAALNNALKVAGAVGLVALWIGTGGGL
ncbi:J domain-containing protein [Anabaena catenula]|uniref:DnaJ domain-containing protein n=1 Tax=Anabaena catenula FACHB-362 TaxID=2692877 RepID=A0ABR8J8Q9_9NOST|nr:DnaJ domain-containing protein [Anabaena catenula]MBD2694229.1 DnaJ domain-containing protein [Anabaena catenula FACHB-362]